MSSAGTAVVSIRLATGRPALALIAKRAYQLSGAVLRPESEQPPIRQEPETAPSRNPGALDYLVHDSDLFAAARPLCDILVRGSAHAIRGPVKTLDTAVQIGSMKKIVRATGERSILLDGQGRLRFSEAEPFTSMPLTWDNAYGGRDKRAETVLFPLKQGRFGRAAEDDAPRLIGYPRNTAGRGFFIDIQRERLEGARLPNLDDPEDPITPDRLLAKGPLDWLDRPAAAVYSAMDVLTFPRAVFFVAPAFEPPTRPVREVRLGALREEDFKGQDIRAPKLDLRAAQSAPAGLSLSLTGRARASLWNLWPGRETVEIDLPPEVPQLILEPPGCLPAELKPMLKTVLFEPDDGRVVLTWSGVMEVASPYPAEMCEAMRRAVRWARGEGRS
jgi:hypothetical protein